MKVFLVVGKKEFQIQEGSTIVGRGENVGILLPFEESGLSKEEYKNISRAHCTLVFKGNKLTIQDTSKHGTLVNNKLLNSEPVELKSGDRIYFRNKFFATVKADFQEKAKATAEEEVKLEPAEDEITLAEEETVETKGEELDILDEVTELSDEAIFGAEQQQKPQQQQIKNSV